MPNNLALATAEGSWRAKQVRAHRHRLLKEIWKSELEDQELQPRFKSFFTAAFAFIPLFRFIPGPIADDHVFLSWFTERDDTVKIARDSAHSNCILLESYYNNDRPLNQEQKIQLGVVHNPNNRSGHTLKNSFAAVSNI